MDAFESHMTIIRKCRIGQMIAIIILVCCRFDRRMIKNNWGIRHPDPPVYR